MLDAARRAVARWIAPKPQSRGFRYYAGARNSRLTAGFSTYSNTSADGELSMALTALRSRSRQLMRDAPYAKRARHVIVNNVVGAGVGMQCQVKTTRDGLNMRVNEDIEDAWERWAVADSCHTGGTLHFADLERALLSEIFTASEVFVRKYYRPFGDSRIPFALELIEAERVADEFTYPQGGGPSTRLGIEVDQFGRPVAYWIRQIHPGELRGVGGESTRLERIDARDVIHLRLVTRWPQTRGEPWLHAVIQKLADMDGYSEAEIIAARAAASYMGFIKSDDPSVPVGEVQSDGSEQLELAPGIIPKLSPGEDFVGYSPNRPNSGLDPFLTYMVREVSTGVPGLTYELLSGDYSRSNFSSSRLGVLDSRDDFRILQKWWARSFRAVLLRDWMQAAVIAREIPSISPEAFYLDPDKFCEVSWKFRGWSWFDPQKDIDAFKAAVRSGFTSRAAVIEQTGNGADIEDIDEQRRTEIDTAEAAGLVYDTDIPDPKATAPAAAPTPSPAAEDNVVPMKAAK